MREFGGYIELEQFYGREYHEGCIALNCGRNALAYLIKARQIHRIALPYFLCGSVMETCRKLGVCIRYYHITDDLLPEGEISGDEYFYVVNYYGQLARSEISRLTGQYPGRLIIDNAQAFFQRPVKGTDTLYTCRKFFGVADGAYLSTDARAGADGLPVDESYARMRFLLGRYERPASEFYAEYKKNNDYFAAEGVRKMSRLTRNLLKGIDYDAARCKRNSNFRCIHAHFKDINRLSLSVPDGPFMYPLYVKDGDRIRKKLLEEKIYIPTLWPDVFRICKNSDLEYDMAENILPLPVDQRYTEDDMEYICSRTEWHITH